jgi:hypothetical protein
VVAYEHQYFFSIEASSTYVPPQPGSHANMVGMYIDELVAAPNPRVGEESEARRSHREKAWPRCHIRGVAPSSLDVDPVAVGDEADGCAGWPFAAE